MAIFDAPNNEAGMLYVAVNEVLEEGSFVPTTVPPTPKVPKGPMRTVNVMSAGKLTPETVTLTSGLTETMVVDGIPDAEPGM